MFMTLDAGELDDRRQQLLDVLTSEFDKEPLLDQARGALLYQRLRAHFTADGATEADFEFLTGQLVRLIIESGNPFTPRQKAAQLTLISDMFAFRNFQLEIERGVLVTIDFADPPTKH
jgi:hypothetical protein